MVQTLWMKLQSCGGTIFLRGLLVVEDGLRMPINKSAW
jgi:hypothetical protein